MTVLIILLEEEAGRGTDDVLVGDSRKEHPWCLVFVRIGGRSAERALQHHETRKRERNVVTELNFIAAFTIDTCRF